MAKLIGLILWVYIAGVTFGVLIWRVIGPMMAGREWSMMDLLIGLVVHVIAVLMIKRYLKVEGRK